MKAGTGNQTEIQHYPSTLGLSVESHPLARVETGEGCKSKYETLLQGSILVKETLGQM